MRTYRYDNETNKFYWMDHCWTGYGEWVLRDCPVPGIVEISEDQAMRISKGTLFTAKTYVLTTTKNSRNRIIAVAPTVMEMLKRQQMLQHEMQIAAGVARANKWNLVFTNELGEHLTHLTVYKDFKRIVSDIGMPNVRFHDLRHPYVKRRTNKVL